MILSGELTPYPIGPLGVIEEGAYADMVLVKGNSLKDLDRRITRLLLIVRGADLSIKL